MTLQLCGMDVGFYHHLGSYSVESRCEMLAELGYASTNLTLWSEEAWSLLPRFSRAAATSGLEIASLYAEVDLALPPDGPEARRVLDLVRASGAPIELTLTNSALTPSDPAGDAAAIAFLEAALDVSDTAEIRLYPHFVHWMERVSDARRLLEAVSDQRLGMTFPAFHVYAVEGADFGSALDAAAPHLRFVNTNGSRRLAGQFFPVTIEPVGRGDFDNFAFLGRLRDLGYTGHLGIQAYGIGGDPYRHFRASKDAVRDIEERLDRHPEWARLETPRL